MEKYLEDLMPILEVSQGCILSKKGDVTMGFQIDLPEIFTLSDQQYEGFHQAWVKALKMLPVGSVFHKQDYFLKSEYKADFTKQDTSFLTHSSERFFNERPFLDHQCYVFITKKPSDRKPSSSIFSNLLRPSLFPKETLNEQALQEFRGSVGQFKRIMEDSGFVKMRVLQDQELLSTASKQGLVERYLYLSGDSSARLLRDIQFEKGIKAFL